MAVFIFSVIIFSLILGAVFLFLKRTMGKGILARSLNMSLYSIALPQDPREDDEEKQKDMKEKIGVMEQFLNSFSNLHEDWSKEFFYGAPYMALEMAVHHKGDQIHIYMAIPRKMESVLEKQVHSFFPYAEVEKVKDYNIFNPQGASAGSYFSLERSPLLPLYTYEDLGADSLDNIAISMTKLQKEGEGVAVQYIIRPSSFRHQKDMAKNVIHELQRGKDLEYAFGEAKHREMFQNVTGTGIKHKQDSSKEHDPYYRPSIDEEAIRSIREKVGKHHFSVNLRILASAHSRERAQDVLKEVESSFMQFNNAGGNSFKIHRAPKRNFKKFVFDYSFRMPRANKAMLVASDELASLFHFPLHSRSAPQVKSVKHRSAPPPLNLPESGMVLGENRFRGTSSVVKLSKNDRRRHMYVIGQTGTGKSIFMYNQIRQDILNGEGVAVIDPHGDLAEKAYAAVPPERKDDVVWFDPGDTSIPFGLNMLEYNTAKPEQKTLVVNELLAIFRKLFHEETMGPVFDQYFRNAALLLLGDYEHEIPTLLDIPKVLTDEHYRRDKLSREQNPVVKNFWEKEAEKAGGEAALNNIAPYITSKINGFVADEFMRPIISQKKSSLNFREAMDSKKIILVNLSKGKLGELNANLIGLIIVGKLLIASLSRVDVPEDARPDFFLYIDEFQNFTTNSISQILSEARKYRLNLIIAHQFIQQLDEGIRNSVFGNVGSMAAFRVGADDAEFLKSQFDPVFTPQDLMNLDNFNAILKLLIDNQTSKPFNIKTYPPEY
ncbi:MAG: DUF87 domain-containing protein [Candidatus Spechtbacterales bacterium]